MPQHDDQVTETQEPERLTPSATDINEMLEDVSITIFPEASGTNVETSTHAEQGTSDEDPPEALATSRPAELDPDDQGHKSIETLEQIQTRVERLTRENEESDAQSAEETVGLDAFLDKYLAAVAAETSVELTMELLDTADDKPNESYEIRPTIVGSQSGPDTADAQTTVGDARPGDPIDQATTDPAHQARPTGAMARRRRISGHALGHRAGQTLQRQAYRRAPADAER